MPEIEAGTTVERTAPIYPCTDPAVNPAMNCRDSNREAITTGYAEIMTLGKMRPRSVEETPRKTMMATGRIVASGFGGQDSLKRGE